MYLPRSQVSLSQCKVAYKGRQEEENGRICLFSPSCGPSRIITSHSRVFHARLSWWQKCKNQSAWGGGRPNTRPNDICFSWWGHTCFSDLQVGFDLVIIFFLFSPFFYFFVYLCLMFAILSCHLLEKCSSSFQWFKSVHVRFFPFFSLFVCFLHCFLLVPSWNNLFYIL